MYIMVVKKVKIYKVFKYFIINMKGKKIPIDNEIKKKLTVTPFMPGSPLIVNYALYKLTNKNMYIPKYFECSGESHIIENPVNKCEIKINSEPREYQKQVIDDILTEINKNDSCIACLYTGWGKTFASLYIASVLGVKTLILVNKQSLLEQWKEQIIKFTGIKPGIIQGKNIDTIPEICIGMIHSISMKDYPHETFNNFSFSIFDETHHYCSKMFSNVFYKIGSKYNLGLTATIKRADRLEYTLEWFLGKVAVNVKFLLIEPKIMIYNYFDYSENVIRYMPNGKINTPSSVTNITDDTTRTDFIVNLVKECYNSDRNILVLTDRKSHCEIMLQKLKNYSVGKYIGGMKNEELINSNKCKIIIATYQMASEGYDNPKLDTLILASPKGNVEQSIGRILRRKNENPALVIDINDCISVFNNWNKKRHSFYKSKKFKIEIANEKEEQSEIDTSLENFSIRE